MKAEDVVKQLLAVLPNHTGLFSDEIPVSSITSVGTVVTVTTAIPHGLTTGNYINIQNALEPVSITSLSRDISLLKIERIGNKAIVTSIDAHNLKTGVSVTISGAVEPEYNVTTKIFVTADNIFYYLVNGAPSTPAVGVLSARLSDLAIAETNSDHDLTYNENLPPSYLTVEISGSVQPEYNGSHALFAVPNRKKFLYYVSGSPASPATGTILLLKNKSINSYNGRFQVTVTGLNTLTYSTDVLVTSPAFGSPIMRVRHRISRSERLQRVTDSYTAQPPSKYWAWVVLENSIMSKSRETSTDATARPDSWYGFRQQRIEQFSVYIIAPTTDEIAAAATRDSMEDVAKAIFKSLMGVRFPTVFCANTHNWCVNVGEANITENSAYYIHQFIFESTIDITACDIINPQDTVAFRDISIDFGSDIFTANDVLISADIDLDDVPL